MTVHHSILLKRRLKLLLIIFLAVSFLSIRYYIQEIDSRFLQPSIYGIKAFIYYQLRDYERAALEWKRHYKASIEMGNSTGDDGLDTLIKGDLQKAKEVSELGQKTPFDITSLLNLGDIAFEENRFNDALHYYQEAVKIDAKNCDGFLGASSSYIMLGAYSEAINDLIACLRTGYLESRVTSFLNVLKTLGYLEHNKIGDGSNSPFCLLAHIYRYLMIYDPWKADDAVEYSWKAIQIGDRSDDAYVTIGVMEQKEGRLKEALAHFLKAIEINPSNPEAYKKAALVYADLGDLQNEFKLKKAAFEANPQDDFYVRQFSRFLAEKFGDYYLALEYATKAYQINPMSVDTLHLTGWLYLSLDQLDKAIAIYEEVIKLQPRNAYAYESLGMCYEKQKKYDEAIAAYSQAIAFNPGSAESYKGLGKIYRELGDRERAIAHYENAVLIDSKDTNALYFLGLVYHEVGRFEDAAKLFIAVLRIDPGHSAANSVLPYTLQNIKKRGKDD